MATLVIRNNCDQTQNTQVSSPTVLQNWRLCWGQVKSGVTLGLDHLYFLSLFDLHALHWFLVWVYFDPLPGFGAPFR